MEEFNRRFTFAAVEFDFGSDGGQPVALNQSSQGESDTEAYFGRVEKAREFSQLAVDSAQHNDAKETAALWEGNGAVREAQFGNVSGARQHALKALGLTRGRDVRVLAALALARAGDVSQA